MAKRDYYRYEESHRTANGVKQKHCTKCKKWKRESEFSKQSARKDGLRFWCKKCECDYMHKYYRRDKKNVRTQRRYEQVHRVVDGVKQKRCRRCNRWKLASEYYRNHKSKDGLTLYCKKCVSKAARKYRKRGLAVRN